MIICLNASVHGSFRSYLFKLTIIALVCAWCLVDWLLKSAVPGDIVVVLVIELTGVYGIFCWGWSQKLECLNAFQFDVFFWFKCVCKNT